MSNKSRGRNSKSSKGKSVCIVIDRLIDTWENEGGSIILPTERKREASFATPPPKADSSKPRAEP